MVLMPSSERHSCTNRADLACCRLASARTGSAVMIAAPNLVRIRLHGSPATTAASSVSTRAAASWDSSRQAATIVRACPTGSHSACTAAHSFGNRCSRSAMSVINARAVGSDWCRRAAYSRTANSSTNGLPSDPARRPAPPAIPFASGSVGSTECRASQACRSQTAPSSSARIRACRATVELGTDVRVVGEVAFHPGRQKRKDLALQGPHRTGDDRQERGEQPSRAAVGRGGCRGDRADMETPMSRGELNPQTRHRCFAMRRFT